MCMKIFQAVLRVSLSRTSLGCEKLLYIHVLLREYIEIVYLFIQNSYKMNEKLLFKVSYLR